MVQNCERGCFFYAHQTDPDPFLCPSSFQPFSGTTFPPPLLVLHLYSGTSPRGLCSDPGFRDFSRSMVIPPAMISKWRSIMGWVRSRALRGDTEFISALLSPHPQQNDAIRDATHHDRTLPSVLVTCHLVFYTWRRKSWIFEYQLPLDPALHSSLTKSISIIQGLPFFVTTLCFPLFRPSISSHEFSYHHFDANFQNPTPHVHLLQVLRSLPTSLMVKVPKNAPINAFNGIPWKFWRLIANRIPPPS